MKKTKRVSGRRFVECFICKKVTPYYGSHKCTIEKLVEPVAGNFVEVSTTARICPTCFDSAKKQKKQKQVTS